MRVPATTAAGPVDALPQDLVDREFSQIMWTNFSGHIRAKFHRIGDHLTAARRGHTLFG